ncbi:hypothetical protein EKO04_007400 [Ascochyta lentis]|uniref:Secreted protein n=1 Tax=Ascochyta lentis TaxID=205686 RepID=A0A8H7MGQ0_9PLEO|nr:hypothetical protein EKO04_007400 [Ascochyta lentis]
MEHYMLLLLSPALSILVRWGVRAKQAQGAPVQRAPSHPPHPALNRHGFGDEDLPNRHPPPRPAQPSQGLSSPSTALPDAATSRSATARDRAAPPNRNQLARPHLDADTSTSTAAPAASLDSNSRAARLVSAEAPTRTPWRLVASDTR